MTPLEIAIDELIVRGLSPSDARVAANALEERLSELAQQSAVTIRERAEASRKLSPVDAESPTGVGQAVADAVWNTLSGGRS